MSAMRIVIPSLGYGDYLDDTLPAWLEWHKPSDIRVVTTEKDDETRAAAARHGVVCVLSDSWHRAGASLNKAGALDDGFGFKTDPPAAGDICIAADADVAPDLMPTGYLPGADPNVQEDTMYGCPRYACQTRAAFEAWRARVRNMVPRPFEALPLMMPRTSGDPVSPLRRNPAPSDLVAAGRKALGYFQMFRYRPGLTFGDSETAGGYDHRFIRNFTHRACSGFYYVVHLGGQDRANWRGRVLPRWGAA